ncbi:MAG: NAD(P)/FAD-dependent oxidoreductase [Lachnospiraceae bacterium]|nr:NAD(P)/FAD-dependent oxidoreductase [Lachnospiraceae bacterium]
MEPVLIIGGGAGGMMAALSAAKSGAKVILIEKNEKTGKKIYITGKGRCNLTNLCSKEVFFDNVISNPRFMYSSYNALDSERTIELFNSLGLKTKVERGGRVFPESDMSASVTDTLRESVRKSGVTVMLDSPAKHIIQNDGVFSHVILEDGTQIKGGACILATGGMSYRATGSCGDGYKMAKQLGHKVTGLLPALVGIRTEETFVKELEGLSLRNVSLIMKCGGKKRYDELGEMLFTRMGISGPLVLTLSSVCAADLSSGKKCMLYIDLKPGLDEQQLDKRITTDFNDNINKDYINSLGKLLPAKLIPVVASLSGIDPHKKVNLISRGERQNLVRILKAFPLTYKCTGGFDEAVITRGGISVREVDPSTLESKLVKGLYFAGEVLDVDALTGGFNLQIAWSTGYVAGKCAAERVCSGDT